MLGPPHKVQVSVSCRVPVSAEGCLPWSAPKPKAYTLCYTSFSVASLVISLW